MRDEPKTAIDKSIITWTCPEVRSLDQHETTLAQRLYADIVSDSLLARNSIDAAGLELRVALMMLQSERGFRKTDNEFWKGKCRSLFLRPAIEPICSAYWEKYFPFNIDAASALRMASAAAGRPLVYRKGPATGRSLNGDVNFHPLDVPGEWLAKIARAAETPALHGAFPAYCFAQTIMTHPFSDGNGRFARLMVHAALAHSAGLAGPRLALAPAFYRRAEALGSALTALSEHGDWSGFNRVFFSTLEDALIQTRALYSRLSRAAG